MSFMCAGALAQAVEVQPVINAQLLGGQNFYNGKDSSIGAMASLSAAPYVKFNDDWSLSPLYSGSYQGTRQVEDLIGGGTLFQETQNHDISAKVIRSFDSGLKLKAIGGYGVQLLRETLDESWGNGLYDNRRASGGAEAEYEWDKDRFVRLSYDYYAIRFPNYTSLESQGATAGLGRELSAPDVLDTHNHALNLGTQVAVPGNGTLEATLGYTWENFTSEHLVDLSGELTPELRRDRQTTFSTQGTWPVLVRPGARLFGSLAYSLARVHSNQNHYDPQQLFFNPNYYSYLQQTLAMEWTLAMGNNPWTLKLRNALTHQHYTDRLIQDANGIYGTDATNVNGAFTTLVFTYPIAKGFRLIADTEFGWNNSNNGDNSVYQYHYNTQTYLLGFSYAY